MSNLQGVRDVIVLSVEKSLPLIQPDGTAPDVHAPGMLIYPYALSYVSDFPGNPYVGDERVHDAIMALGDHNADHGATTDEWTFIKTLEAMRLLGDEVDEERRKHWIEGILRCAKHIEDMSVDMDIFDGQIPNHGIWAHTFMFRAGQVLEVPEYCEKATHALGRVFDSQTADGCWREGTCDNRFVGTPVTGYNTLSAQAVCLYYNWSGDERAAEALDKAWRWYYDFLLPDCSMPPNLDSRQAYHSGIGFRSVAAWWNKPEGRWLGVRAAEQTRDGLREGARVSGHGHGKIALQYPFMEEGVTEREPEWPEYTRMKTEEACIRRRGGWAVVLSGMTNWASANVGLRKFLNERQDCLSIAHEKTGLLVGSAHSQVQEELATFCVYQDGAAYYMPQAAYLKSSAPLDTLLLRYGPNTTCLSTDTTGEDCRVTFSLFGERDRANRSASGHALSARAARARMMLRLHEGDTIKVGNDTWEVVYDDTQILRIDVPAGEAVDFGAWQLACDAPWELRWPERNRNAYIPEEPWEWLGRAEVKLFARTFGLGDEKSGSRPSATFTLRVV